MCMYKCGYREIWMGVLDFYLGLTSISLEWGKFGKTSQSQEHQMRLILQTPQQGDRLHTAAVLQLTRWKRGVAERWLTFVQYSLC